MERRGLLIDDNDSVVVVLEAVAAADVVAYVSSEGKHGSVAATQAIPPFHKIAIRAIGMGEQVVKYGQMIGTAQADIPIGCHVHEHNLD
nr:UxaA family hydrolase [uncultured Sphaerochaeta sp.]